MKSIYHHYKMLGIKKTSPFHPYYPHHHISKETHNILMQNTSVSHDITDTPHNIHNTKKVTHTKNNYDQKENTDDIDTMHILKEEIRKKIIDITSIENLHQYITDLSSHQYLPQDYSRNPVLYRGNIKAPIMLIGEAPGAEEDKQKKPFVGASGKLLDKMLHYINLNAEKDIYITNIVYWRPQNNKTPVTKEIDTFKQLVLHAISILQPKIIMIMGAVSLKAISHTHSIGKIHGTWLHYNNIPAMPLYHPAALLYNSNLKKPTGQDLRKIHSFILENNIPIPSWETP